MKPGPNQQLIFDADDTLWENNVYFERIFDEFVEFLDHSRMGSREVRAALDEIELANREIHGYGALNFAKNMRECYERLCEREIAAEDLERIMAYAERILEQPIELIEGVEETLAALTGRNELLLFTKGHPDEQRMKIDRSGLGRYFAHCEIVKEKDRQSYGELVEARGLEKGRTWMVGNSPRSDINPALELGLGAVYVPHPMTWSLEQDEIRGDRGRLLILNRFDELRRYF
jgi:putative hydrolase of the HAD superfamily